MQLTYLERNRVFLGPKWSKNAPERRPEAENEITPLKNTKFNRSSCWMQSSTDVEVEFTSCLFSHRS